MYYYTKCVVYSILVCNFGSFDRNLSGSFRAGDSENPNLQFTILSPFFVYMAGYSLQQLNTVDPSDRIPCLSRT